MNIFSLLILILLALIGSCYLILASILATEFGDRGIKSYYYGYMLCAYPLASTICCFLVPYVANKIGRSKVLYIGIFLMFISMCLSGAMKYIENNEIMVLYGIFTRTIQGIFKTFILVICVTVLIISNPTEKMKYIGLSECFIGIGNAIGPSVGAIIYSFLGFTWMFIIVGCMFLVFLPLLKLTMPPGIDDNDESTAMLSEKEDPDINLEVSPDKKISYYSMFTDPFILLMAITSMLVYAGYQYYEPVLSFRFEDFKLSVRIQGLIFGSLVFGYSIMCFMTPLFAKYLNQVTLLFGAIFMVGVFNFLIGPSNLLPENIFILIAGLFLSGGAIGVAVIPQIPLMIQRCEIKFPTQNRRASDMCSAIFNGMASFGQVIGPMYGGYLYELVGFRTLCDISGIMFILYSVIFYFLGHNFSKEQNENIPNSSLFCSNGSSDENDIQSNRGLQ